MTYRVISSTETDPNAPVTSTLMVALDENLDAVAAGELNAPKLALKSEVGTFTTGDLDFNGIGAFSGVWFSCAVTNTGGSPRIITFDATDDGGSTYLGSVTLASLDAADDAQIIAFFDFATGVLHGTVLGAGTPLIVNETIAGASLSIDGIRFTGNTQIVGGVLIHPNGGESAT